MLPAKQVVCGKCDQTVQYNDIKKHAYEHELFVLTCIAGCEDETRFVGREEMIKHFKEDCMETDLDCTECKMPLKRKMIESH